MKTERKWDILFWGLLVLACAISGARASLAPQVVHDAYVITRLHEAQGERTWAAFETLHTAEEGQQRYQQLVAEGHHAVRLERHVITVVAGPAR